MLHVQFQNLTLQFHCTIGSYAMPCYYFLVGSYVIAAWTRSLCNVEEFCMPNIVRTD